MSIFPTRDEEKERMSKQLAEDTAAFLEKGGVIGQYTAEDNADYQKLILNRKSRKLKESRAEQRHQRWLESKRERESVGQRALSASTPKSRAELPFAHTI